MEARPPFWDDASYGYTPTSSSRIAAASAGLDTAKADAVARGALTSERADSPGTVHRSASEFVVLVRPNAVAASEALERPGADGRRSS
jgi:hypothetical protein